MVVSQKCAHFLSNESSITQKALASCNFETPKSLEAISAAVVLTLTKPQLLLSPGPWQ